MGGGSPASQRLPSPNTRKKGERGANRRLAKAAIKRVEQELSATSSKTHDYERFAANLRVFNQHTQTVEKHYGSRTARGERFRASIRVQRGIPRLFTRLGIPAVGYTKIIAFGKGGLSAVWGQHARGPHKDGHLRAVQACPSGDVARANQI